MAAGTLVTGLVSVAIYTRFLPPRQFGQLAVLTTVASVVTLLVNLCSLQGTMRRVWGTSGDEDVGDEGGEATSSDPRAALATGLAVTATVGAAIVGIAFALQGDLGELIVDKASDGNLVTLAVGSGAVAAVVRLNINILRLQRRSLAYLVVSLIYSAGSTALAVPLLISGSGIAGVLEGLMIGNSVAAAFALLLLRADVRPAVSLREAGEIMRRGAYYIPLIASFQTIQLADTLLVAKFANFSSAGLYRVAQRISIPVLYGTSVFQQAWGPMRRDLTQVAADQVDSRAVLTARLVTYYAVFVSAMVLGVSVLSEQLVLIAASEYQDAAAALVPVTAVAAAGHGFFVISYRVSRLRTKRWWLMGLGFLAACTFVAGSILLIPAIGAVGAPIAAIAGWTLATSIMVMVGQRGNEPIPYESQRLVTIVLASAAVWTVAYWVLPDTNDGTVLKALLLLAWAGFLVLTDVVPWAEVQALGHFMRVFGGTESKRQLRANVRRLEGGDRELVDMLIRRRVPPDEVAHARGLPEDEVLERLVYALRTAADGDGAAPTDGALGRVLVSRQSHAERDARLHRMVISEGADPIDADLILRTAAAVSARRTLLGISRPGPSRSTPDATPSEPLFLPPADLEPAAEKTDRVSTGPPRTDVAAPKEHLLALVPATAEADLAAPPERDEAVKPTAPEMDLEPPRVEADAVLAAPPAVDSIPLPEMTGPVAPTPPTADLAASPVRSDAVVRAVTDDRRSSFADAVGARAALVALAALVAWVLLRRRRGRGRRR